MPTLEAACQHRGDFEVESSYQGPSISLDIDVFAFGPKVELYEQRCVIRPNSHVERIGSDVLEAILECLGSEDVVQDVRVTVRMSERNEVLMPW